MKFPSIIALCPLVLIGALGSCVTPEPLPDPAYEFVAKARNVILYIGDGMGEGPRAAARWMKVGPGGKLAMDDMPASGWSRTWNSAGNVTDSAAGATAIATGQKTSNGVVGMDARLNAIPTILETAKALGKSTGLVTTTQLTDATPAAFAAHVPSRGRSDEIAAQMINAGVDLMFGGGEDKFLPTAESGCYSNRGERNDARNLIAEAQALGYNYLCRPESVALIEPATTPRPLGLFADGLMGRPANPPLAQMTEKAIAILARDPDGFFLMIEGGLIDKGGHDGNGANMIADTLELDEAVAVGKAFAQTAPDTLIIVTADHDTGGMDVLPVAHGIEGEQGPFYTPEGVPFYVVFRNPGGHTKRDVPVTAQGPSSDAVQGTFENTFIHEVMVKTLQ